MRFLKLVDALLHTPIIRMHICQLRTNAGNVAARTAQDLHHNRHIFVQRAQFTQNSILLAGKERKIDFILNHWGSPLLEHSSTRIVGRKKKRATP